MSDEQPSIRDTIAAMDAEAEEWEEISGDDGDYSVKEYENHEDMILDFAETAGPWIRAALEVLTPEQIDAVDRKMWPVAEEWTWPTSEFYACFENGGHLLSARHTRDECPAEGRP